MIERSLNPERLRFGLLPIFWAIGVAIAGKLAAMTNVPMALMSWQVVFLFVLPLLLPLRFLLTTILSVIVFLDASLWYLQGNFTTNTVYETNSALVKPPEILALVLFVRLMLIRNLPNIVPGFFSVGSVVWIAVIILGGLIALFLHRPLSDILIFSEMRSPILMIIFTIMLAPLIAVSPRLFIDTYAVMLLTHFAISLVSWQTGFSLFWPSFAPNYIGEQTAFFGADESVIVYILANSIAVTLLVSSPDPRLSGFARKFWMIVFAVSAFAIFASLRRAGIGAMALVIVVLFVFSGAHTKLRFLFALAILTPLLFGIAGQAGVIEAIMSRLAGEGSTATSDAGRKSDFLEGLQYVSENFWFGSGPGTRMTLSRTQAYGVYDTLSVHNAILHVWSRFGVLGVLSYCMIFFSPLVFGFAHFIRGSGGQNEATRNLCVVMSGLLLAFFLWTLLTPPIYLNFRQGGVWAICVALIFASIALRQNQPQSTTKAKSHRAMRRSNTGDGRIVP